MLEKNLIKIINIYKEKYLETNNNIHDINIFDWCILNIEDSLSFNNRQKYLDYLESINRAIIKNKNRHNLAKQSLMLVYSYFIRKSL